MSLETGLCKVADFTLEGLEADLAPTSAEAAGAGDTLPGFSELPSLLKLPLPEALEKNRENFNFCKTRQVIIHQILYN